MLYRRPQSIKKLYISWPQDLEKDTMLNKWLPLYILSETFEHLVMQQVKKFRIYYYPWVISCISHTVQVKSTKKWMIYFHIKQDSCKETIFLQTHYLTINVKIWNFWAQSVTHADIYINKNVDTVRYTSKHGSYVTHSCQVPCTSLKQGNLPIAPPNILLLIWAEFSKQSLDDSSSSTGTTNTTLCWRDHQALQLFTPADYINLTRVLWNCSHSLI